MKTVEMEKIAEMTDREIETLLYHGYVDDPMDISERPQKHLRVITIRETAEEWQTSDADCRDILEYKMELLIQGRSIGFVEYNTASYAIG